MSSHREAPESSKDPVADNTDVYAFVSPDNAKTVTLIANFIPFQIPNGGPNFSEFGEDVRYDINISNKGDGKADITYQFRFTTAPDATTTFLYAGTPITDVTKKNWRYQTYSVTRVKRGGKPQVIASNLLSPPVNIGPRTTADYANLIKPTIYSQGGRKFFAGQRADAFFVDLGSIFDLGGLRPVNELHILKLANMPSGINGLQGLNCHSIAIQVPISEVQRYGKKSVNPASPDATIGVWATANRLQSKLFDDAAGKYVSSGGFVQVSRLGNPLINEVVNGVGQKDAWNASKPDGDKKYLNNYKFPTLGALIPGLYPKAFPKLGAANKKKTHRDDIVAILLTGIPKGVIKGFQNQIGTKPVMSDMLRLNLGFKPAKNPKALGLLANDVAGFPNGRRITDNVTAIELMALAGATLPLTDPKFVADKAVAAATDKTTNSRATPLKSFPYMPTPAGGYQYAPGTPKSSN